MIIETLLSNMAKSIQLAFGWINLPDFPENLKNMIWQFFDLMFSSASCLSFFVRVSTVKILLPVLLIVINFDHIFKLVMFVLRKIPFVSIE